MQPDMKLVELIFSEAEKKLANGGNFIIEDVVIEGYTTEQIGQHIRAMVGKGYLKEFPELGSRIDPTIIEITPRGKRERNRLFGVSKSKFDSD